MIDWTGAQIGNNDGELLGSRAAHVVTNNVPVPDSDDIRNVDLNKVHNLSGPIAIEGAEPGDCLVVDILDSELIQTALSPLSIITVHQSLHSKRCPGDIQWGTFTSLLVAHFTPFQGIFELENGGGLFGRALT